VSIPSDSESFWCGSVIQGEDGRYHMFSSRMAHNCGLDVWSVNSECVRAVSDSPLGPFKVEELVVPALCHNPTVHRASDGNFLLYYTGGDRPMRPGSLYRNCTDGITNPGFEAPLQVKVCLIRLRVASSIYGPWSDPITVSHIYNVPICATNPAPLVNKDDSVLMYYRAYQLVLTNSTVWPGEVMFVSYASHYLGPYKPVRQGALFDSRYTYSEDAYAFTFQPDSVQMVFNNKFMDELNVGGHAVSPNGLDDFVLQKPVYSLDIDYGNGVIRRVRRRERPQFLFYGPDQGVLYTGIQEDGSSDRVVNLAVPIGLKKH